MVIFLSNDRNQTLLQEPESHPLLKAIGDAVKLVGNIPEKAIEKATVYRYGHLCYTIHRTYKSNNIPVPKEHLKRVEKAVSLLEPIAEDPKNLKMQVNLAYVLDEN